MILASSYFPPIFHFALIAQQSEYFTEQHEHFVKQSFRSRCEIYGANGKLSLIIPLKRWKNNSLISDIKISYDENWQQIHWKSIESAYRASPYFEFYEEDIKPLFFLKTESLIERNSILEKEIKSILGILTLNKETTNYKSIKQDLRVIIHPKNLEILERITFPKYIQVFEEKEGFIPNLSILDLLFNLGPESKSYLQTLSTPF